MRKATTSGLLFVVTSAVVPLVVEFTGMLVVDPDNESATTNVSVVATTASYCTQEPCDVSIVFMGDSLTRFMYYSFVYYLRHDRWIVPESFPNLVKPADIFGGYELNFDWMPWFNASMAALSPYENCDCFRQPGSIVRGPGRNWVCENRYYYDPVRNNTVIFYQAYGSHIPIRGHWEDPRQAMTAQQRLQKSGTPGGSSSNVTVGPLRGRQPYTWSYDWPTAIRRQVARIRPNVLVLNAGKWAHDFDKPDFVESVVAAIRETGIPRAIWKTTTANRNGSFDKYVKTDTAMCNHEFFRAEGGGCLNLTGWTSKLSKDYFIDLPHFREPAYRKMNEQLMEHLGILPQGSNGTSVLTWKDLGIEDEMYT